MTTELTVTQDGEIVEPRAPMTLFGTDNPAAVVERASSVATALASVIAERKLSSRISGKEHVNVEGWTLLGSMLGVFAEVEWSRPLDNGWEARAVARTLNGNVVGAADAMCTRSEGSWSRRDEYALRSMAQTRAVSKALRLPLGFIMHLAGYSATPAEELADEQPERGRGAGPSASSPRDSAPVKRDDYRKDELVALMREHSLDLDAVERYAAIVGIQPGSTATHEQMDALIEAVRGHGTDAVIEPPVTPAGVSDSGPAESPEAVPPAASGPPPKPGTDEYKALPVQDRANAKAYWANPPEQESLAELMGAPA